MNIEIGSDNDTDYYFASLRDRFQEWGASALDVEATQIKLETLVEDMESYHKLKPRTDVQKMDELARLYNLRYGLKVLGIINKNSKFGYIASETSGVPNSSGNLGIRIGEVWRRTRLITNVAGRLLGGNDQQILPSSSLIEEASIYLKGLFDNHFRADGATSAMIGGEELVRFTYGIASELKQKGSTRQSNCMTFIPSVRNKNKINPDALRVDFVGGKGKKNQSVDTVVLDQPTREGCAGCRILGLCMNEKRTISNDELNRLAIEALYERVCEEYQAYLLGVQI